MSTFLFFDILSLIVSVGILNYRRTLTFYHPGVILILFHVYCNTSRFAAVTFGADFAFSDTFSVQGATEDELQRALLLSDIAMLCASLAIAYADGLPVTKYFSDKIIPVKKRYFYLILSITIPIGLFSFVTQLYIPEVQQMTITTGRNDGFTLMQTAETWLGLSLLALVYFYGFKPYFTIPLLIYLLIIGIQGYHRYRLLLPCLFLLITYLYHEKRKWPKLSHIILMIALLFVMLPLKIIGTAIQEGSSFSEIQEIFVQSLEASSKGKADDQFFLDQYAMTLSELDRSEKVFYGGTLLPLVTLPIPRETWPDKPRLNQWQIDISTLSRPFDRLGTISTIYGESYANFRLLGVLLIPAALFYFLTRWYNKVKSHSVNNLEKFAYTVIFVCMIQVMRDGLISLFIFPVLNNMPLFLIYCAHKLFSRSIKST